MKIGIICAMQEELDSILNKLNLPCSEVQHKQFTTIKTKYFNHELLFILSGIGKVNAAIHTQHLIERHEIDAIINVGVAGSLNESISFGDVVIATDLVQYDVDVTAFNIPLGQIPRMAVFAFATAEQLLTNSKQLITDACKIHYGRIISGDRFLDDSDKAKFLATEFNAIACEMEGAAIAHTCYLNSVPFIVIRSISDMAGNKSLQAIHSFTELKNMAAQRAALIVQNLLKIYLA